jgi:hypothetical protein
MSADKDVIGAAEVGSGVPVPAGGPAPGFVRTPASSVSVVTTPAATHAEHTEPLCANCGATVNSHYCSSCGQKNEHPVHSLWHFISEATEDLTHADSRLWRTLGAVLFKPGFLTTEFLAGRRARYLPPIRLYLVVSVLFFLFLALAPHHEPTPAERAQIAREVQEAHGTEYIVIGDPNIKSPEERHRHAVSSCARADAKLSADIGSGATQSALRSVIHKGCLSVVEDNGHALSQAFLHNLPKALFLTLPIMAALMKLLYRRPGRYYVEHLLFLLHNYSFVFLWSAAMIMVGLAIDSDKASDPLSFVLLLYAFYYFFASLRQVYPESWGWTAVKFTTLSFSYLVLMGSALVATIVYSVLAE